MATSTGLSHINHAFNGETPTLELEPSFIETNENKKQIEGGFAIFMLKAKNKQGGTYIPNIEDIYNPKTKKVERARFLAGIESIWMKDQKDLTIDYVRSNARSISFPRGAKCLRVANHDHTTLEFLRLSNLNINNPNRTGAIKHGFEFYEYDPATEATAALEKELLEMKMSIVASELPLDKMKKIASFVNIKFVDDFGLTRKDEQVRTDLMLYAKRNPQIFQKFIDSKEVEVQYMVKTAVREGIIDIGQIPGKALWAKDGGVICSIPKTEKPLHWLTSLATSNTDEGIKFMDKLKTIVT